MPGGKNDGSKTDTSDSALSESKTSVSSQASAPDDFVMVELVSALSIINKPHRENICFSSFRTGPK